MKGFELISVLSIGLPLPMSKRIIKAVLFSKLTCINETGLTPDCNSESL